MKIYADNAATTKLDTDAFEAMKPYLLEDYANPSGAYSFSKMAKRALKEARQTIAECINAEPEQIIFTSGGTESNNHAIKHFTVASDICHVVTSAIEHHSVLYACENSGFELFIVPVDRYGVVSADDLEKVLGRDRPAIASCDSTLVTIMTANNEIGTIEPIAEIGKIAKEHGVLFHTDAVQAVGHIPIDVHTLGVDLLSASAHKFNGPKGIGFLYIKKGVILHPYADGGSQERGSRAGTENVAGIVGMAAALKKNTARIEAESSRLKALEYTLVSRLHQAGLDFMRNGADYHLPGNVNLSFHGGDGEMLLHRLDLKGICISTGSACDSINTQVSHVIKAIHVPKEYAEGTIRITFGANNTEDDAVKIADAILQVMRKR